MKKHICTMTIGAAMLVHIPSVMSATALSTIEQNRFVVAGQLNVNPDSLTVKQATKPYQSNPMKTSRSGRSTSGVSDMVGTLSVEKFPQYPSDPDPNLYYTHESADGFRGYLERWYRSNFVFRDSGVGVWQYHDAPSGDNFDLWSANGTDYGIDAVRAAFHSGHGGMWSTNVFFAPMGSNWADRGWNAFSTQMFLGGNNYSYGDERLRYMFWDTCNSVMISGGNNPYSTWGTRARGVRMVFGYETTSIDSPNYGKFFWEEWNKGKTLAQAFVDASWRINTRQSPAVVAFGSDANDAGYRLNNERYLYAGAVGNNWGQWRWYNARSVATSVRSAAADRLNSQQGGTLYSVVPRSNMASEVTEIAHSFGINVYDASQIQKRPFGLQAVETKAGNLVVEKNGNFELLLKTANTQGGEGEVTDEEIIQKTYDLATQLGFASNKDLQAGIVRTLNQGGRGRGGVRSAAQVIEKTVVLDQLVQGVPFIDPQAGHLEVTFDSQTGQAKRVRSTLQEIDTTSQKFATRATRLTVKQARAAALKLFAKPGDRAAAVNQQTLSIAPGSEAVGYQVLDGKVVPVFRAEIRDSKEPFGRPKLAVVPLIQTD